MQLTPDQQVLSFVLPKNTLEYFDVASVNRTDTDMSIILEEKNMPPLEERHRGSPVLSKGFQDITITDFPIRGRKTKITFRRRRWQVGDELLKRDIDLCAPGTLLEKEFGDFLKV